MIRGAYAMKTLVFAMIYKVMPRVRPCGLGRMLWLGRGGQTRAAVTIGRFLIGLYIGKKGRHRVRLRRQGGLRSRYLRCGLLLRRNLLGSGRRSSRGCMRAGAFAPLGNWSCLAGGCLAPLEGFSTSSNNGPGRTGLDRRAQLVPGLTPSRSTSQEFFGSIRARLDGACDLAPGLGLSFDWRLLP